MFEIRVSRMWDGRYLSVMPGIHPNCSCISNTLQGAVRMAQASALNLMADFIRGNRQMPEEMKDWFYTVTPAGSTSVGGVQHNTVKNDLLIHPDNNVIPKRPVDQSKPALPKRGTPEFDKLMAKVLPSPAPAPVAPSTTAPTTGPTISPITVPAPTAATPTIVDPVVPKAGS